MNKTMALLPSSLYARQETIELRIKERHRGFNPLLRRQVPAAMIPDRNLNVWRCGLPQVGWQRKECERVGEVNQSLLFPDFKVLQLSKVNQKLVARNPQDLCQESKIENENPQLLAGTERRGGDQERNRKEFRAFSFLLGQGRRGRRKRKILGGISGPTYGDDMISIDFSVKRSVRSSHDDVSQRSSLEWAQRRDDTPYGGGNGRTAAEWLDDETTGVVGDEISGLGWLAFVGSSLLPRTNLNSQWELI